MTDAAEVTNSGPAIDAGPQPHPYVAQGIPPTNMPIPGSPCRLCGEPEDAPIHEAQT